MRNIDLSKNKSFLIIMLLIFILEGGYLNNLPSLLLIIPIVFGMLASRYKITKFRKEELKVLLFGGYLLLITIVNADVLYNVTNIINVFIQYLLVVIAVHVNYTQLDSEFFFIGYRNIGTVLAILCIIEKMIGNNFFSTLLGKNEIGGNTFRVTSIFEHPIICGLFLVILILTLLVYPLKKPIRQYICMGVSLLALIFTQSRSAWIALIICFVIYCLKKKEIKIKLNKKKFTNYVVFALVTFLSLAVFGKSFLLNFVSLIVNRLKGMFEAGEGKIVRFETIINSFNYWFDGHELQMIFGTGMNADLLFMLEHPISKFGGAFVWTAAIDNQYVSLIHECGLIGLIIFLVIVYHSTKSLFYTKDKNQLLICLCLLLINIMLFFFEGLKYVSVVLIAFYLYELNLKNGKRAI